jgi:hypothetical protein
MPMLPIALAIIMIDLFMVFSFNFKTKVKRIRVQERENQSELNQMAGELNQGRHNIGTQQVIFQSHFVLSVGTIIFFCFNIAGKN